MKTVYDGAVVTDEQGVAEVELPDYAEALNEDFLYQLTVVGQFAQAIVRHKIKGNYFVIQTDKPFVEVNWQVTGKRKAQFSKKDRPKTVTEKPDEFKGKYYYPEFFRQTGVESGCIHPPEQRRGYKNKTEFPERLISRRAG